jgi:orotidine-5'-phosphate decarboxylase
VKNFADRLVEAVRKKKSCLVAGLDPRLDLIPSDIRRRAIRRHGRNLEGAAAAVLEFSKAFIDIVAPHVPAIKPQVAFFERLGWPGFRAYCEAVAHARRKGLIVIGDVKRGDIGSTMAAYADGHLGRVRIEGAASEPIGADAITVTAYVGSDVMEAFAEYLAKDGKGIFILVRTSNPSAGDLQDIVSQGKRLYETAAGYVTRWGAAYVGRCGYSAVGAVVGGTVPRAAARLRRLMPRTIFLVPGFGAQGATAEDVRACFKKDGSGAVVASARAINFAYTLSPWKDVYGEEKWERAVEEAVVAAKQELNRAISI